MQKFIITLDGELRFGDVHLHKDLLPLGEIDCFGGDFGILTKEEWQSAFMGVLSISDLPTLKNSNSSTGKALEDSLFH